MNKKTIIFLIVVFIIILIVVSVFHKKSKSVENKIENANSIGNITYEYDASNSIYVIYDKNTNEVLQTTYDEGMVQMYLDNPDFDPTFPGVEVEFDESDLDTVEKK